ncbi:MAG: formylglycine-generating enzyme family protein [Elusimicrobia bacterium]|nr:formylglycine-generating enzyme family protein [Elusimicrobiota bacterium]
MMGAGGGEPDEAPRHRVTVQAFRMAKTEVTFGQHKKCVEAGTCEALRCVGQGEDYPVDCVSWEQARRFSEWEYAARSGGKDDMYPWGDAKASCDLAVMGYRGILGQPLSVVDTVFSVSGKRSVIGKYGCGKDAAWPACSKPGGNTAQGLCDMAGNVCEWTQDWYHSTYNGAPSDGSAWEKPRGLTRVIRGGSWFSSPLGIRVFTRRCGVIALRKGFLGFRPVRAP